jgi:hypothetical protein
MEKLMKLSLSNLVGKLTGRGSARTSRRRTQTSRLHVEQLDQRLVPTVNLANKLIGFGNVGTLFVYSETINGSSANFSGGFEDGSGHWIPVTGHLQQQGAWDQMTFHGGISNFVTSESVKFNGWVNEPSLNKVLGGTVAEGTLTEDFSWLQSLYPSIRFGHSSTSEWVHGYAQYIPV